MSVTEAPLLLPGTPARVTPYGQAIELDKDDDKPPFFLPNRTAYRRAAKGVKTRQRKATKWAYRLESAGAPLGVVSLFENLAEGARLDLITLQEARS